MISNGFAPGLSLQQGWYTIGSLRKLFTKPTVRGILSVSTYLLDLADRDRLVGGDKFDLGFAHLLGQLLALLDGDILADLLLPPLALLADDLVQDLANLLFKIFAHLGKAEKLLDFHKCKKIMVLDTRGICGGCIPLSGSPSPGSSRSLQRCNPPRTGSRTRLGTVPAPRFSQLRQSGTSQCPWFRTPEEVKDQSME